MKAALDAHGDFAEALEAEQRLIVERLTAAVQQEASMRQELHLGRPFRGDEPRMKRVSVMETDVQKVRGHLPILFASPTAFR